MRVEEENIRRLFESKREEPIADDGFTASVMKRVELYPRQGWGERAIPTIIITLSLVVGVAILYLSGAGTMLMGEIELFVESVSNSEMPSVSSVVSMATVLMLGVLVLISVSQVEEL